MMAQISLSCLVMRCVLLRNVRTSTLSVYSLTCNAASSSRSSLRSSMSSRSGMYLARSTKFIEGSRSAAAASRAPAVSSPIATSSSSSSASAAVASAPLADVSIGAASTFDVFVSLAFFAASLDASEAIARASASAASMVSLISQTFFVSASAPTPSHALSRSRIMAPRPAASVALDSAYSANCCLATWSLRLPSAASDSACARAISACSTRSAASSTPPSPSWSSSLLSSPAAMFAMRSLTRVSMRTASSRCGSSAAGWMSGGFPASLAVAPS